MPYMIITSAALLISVAYATAQATEGMGPVYRTLQQQGFTNIRTVRDRTRNRIRVTAQRGSLTRRLIYDATTGALLWDNLAPDRDRTRDRIYQRDFGEDRDRDRFRDGMPDRVRDPTGH